MIGATVNRGHSLWSAFCVSCACLLLSGFTVAKDPNVDQAIVWPISVSPNTAVTIMLQENGTADVSDGSDLLAVQQALSAWNAGCSSFSFTYGGTQASGQSSNDGVNIIAWRENGDPALTGAVATAIRSRNTATTPNTWEDVDILLSGVDGEGFIWSTEGHAHRYDVGHVVTHELGHVLGLQHGAHPEATMYFGGTKGHTFGRTLHADDAAGLCFLYPSGAETCSVDTDCPLLDATYGGSDVRLRCNAGTCEQGAAGYGADCLAPGHCASGACVDDPRNNNGADPGWCSTSCSVAAADCPGGDLCSAAAGSPLCLLGRDDCLFNNDCDVDSNDVCPLDLDGRYRCRDLCQLDAHCDEPARCHGALGDNPPGFCRLPGPVTLGQSCNDGYDCESLSCAGSASVPVCVADPLPEPGMEPDPAPDPMPDPAPDPMPDPAPDVEPDPSIDGGENGPVSDAGGDPEPDPGPATNFEPDPGDDAGSGGCGCAATTPSEAAFFALFGFALFWRRRHRRRGQTTRAPR